MKKTYSIVQKTGFSLIELMAVVVIIGALAAVLISRASNNIDNARIKSCIHNRSVINSAAERFWLLTGSAPTDIGDLNNPNYLEGAVMTCPVTGNAYALDAGTSRVIGHTSTTAPGDH